MSTNEVFVVVVTNRTRFTYATKINKKQYYKSFKIYVILFVYVSDAVFAVTYICLLTIHAYAKMFVFNKVNSYAIA